MLSQKEVKRLFFYDLISGLLIWKGIQKRTKKWDIAGCFTGKYPVVGINGKVYLYHQIIWLWHKGYIPENDIDHEDRNKHNTWINNLREVSRMCNNRNTCNPKNNKSKVKGVSWNSKDKIWRAQIQLEGKVRYLSSCLDFTEAVAYRLAAEQCLDWSNCDSSSPAFQYMNRQIEK